VELSLRLFTDTRAYFRSQIKKPAVLLAGLRLGQICVASPAGWDATVDPDS
jgi:hypothetical protein